MFLFAWIHDRLHQAAGCDTEAEERDELLRILNDKERQIRYMREELYVTLRRLFDHR